MKSGFIPTHGGYENLLSYRKAEIVYDATVWFCDRWIDRRSRTRDQMIQAARSGKQNIAEASMASATSKETEIKLTNVARASLEELLIDYGDFLRVRGLRPWEKGSREALYVRRLGYGSPTSHGSHGTYGTHGTHGTSGTHGTHAKHATYETYRPLLETRPPEIAANIVICVIHQANYLLDRQIRQLEAAFLQDGGLRERMTRARIEARNRGRRS